MAITPHPLVILSNRLPFIVARNPETEKLERKQCAGGLVTAVAPAVIESGGLWVGWPGLRMEDDVEVIPEVDPDNDKSKVRLKNDQIMPINIPQDLFEMYYNGCCNSCLWPLFHSMPDRAQFETEQWEAYQQVNEHFAELGIEAIQRKIEDNPANIPLVWIHDYHLMLAPSHIRAAAVQENLRFKLAFFLHIPFPSWDIFRLIPWNDEILQSLLSCDSVGFHVEHYCLNFIDCCQRILGCRVDRHLMLVENLGRSVPVHALPISIPFNKFHDLSLNAKAVVKRCNEKLIVAVDRLDYTKGITHRMRALEQLLLKHPEHVENVILLQVVVPSRTDIKEYQDLKEEIDQLIGQINGQFSTPNWSPVRYIYGCVPQDELTSFYRDSSVALVTPIRDGMNLIAKEFVACQTGEPGVLVLSPFAGAGSTMHEALHANPLEIGEYADVIHRALTMPRDERELRMQQLRRREREMDVEYWIKTFLMTMDCLSDEVIEKTKFMPINEEYFNICLSSCLLTNKQTRLALLLDYDGTLAPMAPKPELARLPDDTRKVLEKLVRMPDVKVAIISGRSLENIKEMVNIEGITYAGNHGLEIYYPDGTSYVHPVPQEHQQKLDTLIELLSRIEEEGAWLERKGSVITFHYRLVPKHKQIIIKEKAQKCFSKAQLNIHPLHMGFEARPPVRWDKGRAAIHILKTLYGAEWSDRVSIIFAGDDTTDEDAMKALHGIAATFRVTDSPKVRTNALYRLPNTDAVFNMLRWIDKTMSSRLPTRPRSSSNLVEMASPIPPAILSEFQTFEN